MTALEPHFPCQTELDHSHVTPLAAPIFTQAQMDATRNFHMNLNHIDAAVQETTQKTLADYMLAPIEILPNGGPIRTLTALFDTGVLQASYIRKSLIADNPTLAALVKPCAVQVTLGDGSDSRAIEVSGYVHLPLRCTDVQGRSHTADTRLLLMNELSEDIIIGLPHLVRNFSALFVSHLMGAIRTTHARKTEAANLTTLHSQHSTFKQTNSQPLQRPEPELRNTMGYIYID